MIEEKKKKEEVVFNPDVFSTIFENAKADPLLTENIAEALALSLVAETLEIEEIPETEWIEENGRMVERNVVRIEERPNLDENGNLTYTDSGEISFSLVPILNMKKAIKIITPNKKISVETVQKLLHPLTSGKAKTAYINGMSRIKQEEIKGRIKEQQQKAIEEAKKVKAYNMEQLDEDNTSAFYTLKDVSNGK